MYTDDQYIMGTSKEMMKRQTMGYTTCARMIVHVRDRKLTVKAASMSVQDL